MTQHRPENSPYEIVETPEFLGLAQDMLGSVERWDDIKWAGDWLLEKAPERGNYLPHYRLWVLPLRTVPSIWVYYRIDQANRRVFPLDIQVFPY